MARDYGRIRSQFWTDEKVKSWPLDLKAVASYLMTCEHATALGAFRLPAAYMSDDLDIAPSQARAYLTQLEALGFIKVCASGWIWIVNYLRHNRPENVNVWKHIRALANAMPVNVSFRAAVLETIERRHDEPKTAVSEGEKEPEETVLKPYANGSETISNNNTEPNPTEPNRTQPNLEREGAQAAPRSPSGSRLPPDWKAGDAEHAFAAEQGFSPDATARIAEQFRDYWHAVAGSKGRKTDWLATWRNWVRREAEGLKNGAKSHTDRGREAHETFLAAAFASAGGTGR